MRLLRAVPWIVISVFVAWIIPWQHVLSENPASGGDTGSHFYPLWHLLQSGTLRPWNAGNLGGEP